ncbi:unnamed protein product [Effrenium voratum]|nr:unnamed protein product [Effrenium voratum]
MCMGIFVDACLCSTVRALCTANAMGNNACCEATPDNEEHVPYNEDHAPQRGRSTPMMQKNYVEKFSVPSPDPWSRSLQAKQMRQIPKVNRSCFMCYTCAAPDQVRKAEQQGPASVASLDWRART